MTVQLKGTIIDMKTLSQEISDLIHIGAGEAEGRYLSIIFTQEAAAQFSDSTIVYLSWRHIEKNVKGYNAFTEIERKDTEDLLAEEQPPMWTIRYPKEMLHEGHVMAAIELVDDISVAVSRTFEIDIAGDPWEGSNWIEDDDLSEFKKAVNRVQNIQQTVFDDHARIEAILEELAKINDIIDYVDEDGNGINDEDETSSTGRSLRITEWTGEDDSG